MGITVPGRLVSGTVVGTDISLTADIRCESMRHSFVESTRFGKAANATPVTQEDIAFAAVGEGVITGFHGLLFETGSGTSITLDLKKNGTSVLSAPITITNSTPDKQIQDATILTSAYVAGDVYTFVMTVSSSTGAQGPFAFLTRQDTSVPV